MSASKRSSLRPSFVVSPPRYSSIKKSSTLPDTKPVNLSVTVPPAVSSIGKQILDTIWDSSCPFASLFVWIQVLMGIYYLFLMPDINVKIEQDQVKAEKVTRSVRGWLFIVSIGCAIFGYMTISQGCEKAGPQWAVLWFLAATIFSWFITRLILASIEKTTLTNASNMLKAMN